MRQRQLHPRRRSVKDPTKITKAENSIQVGETTIARTLGRKNEGRKDVEVEVTDVLGASAADQHRAEVVAVAAIIRGRGER